MCFKNLFSVFVLFIVCPFLIAQEKSLTLKELCLQSSDIVIGIPISINTYKTDDGKGIYSLIDISIKKKIKGSLESNNIVRLPMFGGTIDGITTYAVGFPIFSLKMKSIYFLNEDLMPSEKLKGPQRIFFITGLSQGKIDVIENEGENILRRDYANTTLELEENGESISLSSDKPTTVEEITTLITNYLNN